MPKPAFFRKSSATAEDLDVIEQRRRTAFMRKAYELARTGHHADELTIEAALAPDYPEAREWLSNSSLREGLRQVCELARSETDNSGTLS